MSESDKRENQLLSAITW